MQSDFLSADGVTENGILNGVYSIAAVSDSISDANDQISEAVSVTSGTYYSYQISESGDVDMFSITVSAGTTVTFATSQSVSTAIDTYIRLFNSAGTQLAYDDDGGTGYFSSLTYTFSTAGTYYLGVSGYGNSSYSAVTGLGDSYGSTGDYYFEAVAGNTLFSDPDDTIAEARLISNGTVTDTISNGIDVDMYKFTVAAGNRVTMTISGTVALDSYLRLFDSSGNQLACNDDFNGYDSSITYTFSTAGTYYLGVSGYGNSSYSATAGTNDNSSLYFGGYSLALSGIVLAADDPDDAISEARSISNGTVSDSISPGTDVDMYKFTVHAGNTVTMTISGTSTLDSYLRLFDSSGAVLAYNDDYSNYNSRISYTFSTAGTYYLGVSGYGNSSYSAASGTNDNTAYTTGTYSLTLSGIGVSADDPDDTIAEARTITNGSVSDSISVGTDVDMYKFTVAAGNTVTMTISGTSTLDSYLRLFDSAGTRLAYNDDYSNYNSRISYTFSTAGTYYLGVSGYGNSSYSATAGTNDSTAYTTGSYTLTLNGISIAADDPDDAIAEARAIGNGSVSDSVSSATDVDMYKFTVGAGSTVTFTTSVTDSLDTYIRLFNSAGTQLAYDDDSSTGRSSTLTYTFNTTGTYYLGVSGYGNHSYNALNGTGDNSANSTGNYTLTVSGIVSAAAGTADPDDTIAEARSVSNGTCTDSITAGDVDMYKFTVGAGDVVTFTTSGTSGLDSYIRLFNASGAQLACDDDSATDRFSSLRYTFNTGGTYYLGVAGYGNRNFDPIGGAGDVMTASTGAYQLTVSGIGSAAAAVASDPDDTIAEARAIGNATVGDSISVGTDVDMYKITVGASCSVTFRTAARDSDTVDTVLRLFNSSGTQLAYNDDGGSGNYSLITYSFTAPGTYYLGVSSYSNLSYNAVTGENDRSGGTGTYSLTVSGIVSQAPVAADPDDAISEAIQGRNGTFYGTVDPNTDVDMYKITVSAGDTVSMVTSPNGSDTVDTYLRLFSASGTELTTNDDGGSGNYSSLTCRFTNSGTYYLGVSSYGNSSYNAVTGNGDSAGRDTGSYTLTISGITNGTSDPDDAISEARQLSGVISDTITSADVDMYKITVSAGSRVTFSTSAVSATTAMDTWLRLFNASGTQLAYDDDGGSGHYSSLSYTFSNGGTYYLGVSGYGNSNYNALTGAGDSSSSSGSYYLTAAVSNNQRLIDHAISLGAIGNSVVSSQMRTLSTTSDIHLYSFTVSAGQSVYFDIDREASSSLDSYIRLFNSSGTVLGSSDDCAGPGEASTRDSYLRYTFTTAGIYYLGVSSYGNSSYVINRTPTGSTSGGSAGMYTLYVGNSAVDDMDDQISEAVSVSVGASASGAISEGTDVDMYKVTVSAGERLTFNVGLNTLSDSYLRLFNASGTQLAYDDDSGTGRGSMLSYTFSTAGTYYVGVSGYGNGSYNAVSGSGDLSSNHLGSYSLSVTREIVDDSYENNNTRSSAASLGTLNAGGQITGLKMADAADWYRFRLDADTGASGAISISFKHSDGDLDMVLYDSNNNRIGYSASSGNSESVSLANLNAGEYYLHVYGYDGAHNPDYTLSYSTSTRPAPTEPGTEDGTNYVVLFAGGYDARNNHARYYYNIKEMYENMISIGIEAENIYVLYADGTNSAQDQYIMQSSSSGYYVNSNMSYASASHVLAATTSNLAAVFNTLSTTVTDEDHFLFYSFDHGTELSNGEGLCCWDRGVVSDQTFATYANSINAKYETYIMAQCYSGGMIEDITVGSNVFACSASSAENPSHSGIRYNDPTYHAGFSKGVSMAFAAGINNTTQLYNYAVTNDPYASRDLPQSRGGSFSIFQNVDTNALQNSNDIAGEAESARESVVLSINASGSENGAPVISDVTVKSDGGMAKESVHAGDICFIDADMEDPDGDAISKVTYYLMSDTGDVVLLGVADTVSDFLWRLSEDVIPGDYTISVSAEDSYGNVSEVYECDIVIKPVNTEPEIRNLEISTSSAAANSTVRISGQVFDAEGDFVDNVKIYLDADQDDELMYPEECLGTAIPDADGNWSLSFKVNTNLERGTYKVFAVAMDEEYREGKSSQLSLEVLSLFQGDVISVSDSKNDLLRISSEEGADYFSVQVGSASVNVISLLEDSLYYGDNSKDGEISGFADAEPQLIIAREDGVPDLFIARCSGTWGEEFQASHTGNGSWLGNNSCAELTGKNRISDIFEGRMDANALVLSDSANGDALFLEDLFSSAPSGGQERLAEIDEIFAGAGDDVVDLTSRQLAFSGDSLKVHGGLGDDTIWAFAGENILYGDAGNDELIGGSDSDIIAGGIGNDTMHGGGGEDIFTFCDNWGTDSVEQLADGNVTLWFAEGDISCWDAETKTFAFDGNTVTVTGVDSDKISIYFGDDGSDSYDTLAAAGAFEGASTAKIYDDKNEGVIVILS